MNDKAVVDGRAFAEAMRAEFERTMQGVIAAVNQAPDGEWIEGSEQEVRDLMVAFQQKAYQRALQMRTQAAEAAFSPCACGDGRQGVAVQRTGRA